MQDRGEKSEVICAKCTRYCTCGCNRPLYQNQRRKPPRDSDIDTISGSFLLHFLRIAMQDLMHYLLKLVLEEGKLQDFVSLNQVIHSRPI